jgi:hypothetical protein
MFWLMLAATSAAQQKDRWLHVRVKDTGAHPETVTVNLPLSLAEKVLPTINAHELRRGKVRLRDADLNGVDLRALLDAVGTAADGEFVKVESPEEDVRVAKEGDHMLIRVRENHRRAQRVDARVPMSVVNAMISGSKDELDLVAGVRALSAYGDTALVTVDDKDESVRIWVDSRSTMD